MPAICGTSAVHYDRIHARLLEQHDVLRERCREVRIAHGMAAEFDDHRLPAVALHIGQRFRKDARLRLGCRWRRRGRLRRCRSWLVGALPSLRPFRCPDAPAIGRRTALIAARQPRSTEFARDYGSVLAQDLLYGAMMPPGLSGRVAGNLHKHPETAVEHSGPCDRPLALFRAVTGELLMPQPFADAVQVDSHVVHPWRKPRAGAWICA